MVESPEKRTNTWQSRHSEAELEYSVRVSYPKRLEGLIHAELASRRYHLKKSCVRCERKDSEGFAVNLKEAQEAVEGWGTIVASSLYIADRTLSPRPRDMGSGISDMTAETLVRVVTSSSEIGEQDFAEPKG